MSADRDWQRREDELFAAIEHMASGDKFLAALELALQTSNDGMRPHTTALRNFVARGQPLSQSQQRLLETFVVLMVRHTLAADRPRFARVLKIMQGEWRGRIEGSRARRYMPPPREAEYEVAGRVMLWQEDWCAHHRNRAGQPRRTADRSETANMIKVVIKAVADERRIAACLIKADNIKWLLQHKVRVREHFPPH